MDNKLILVVDDEPYLIRSLTFILAKSGFKILTAADGEEALRTIREQKPDLVFLDLMLPKLSGYDVCEAVRRTPELNGTYIIVLSAKGGESDRLKALNAGANEFISKPFSPLEALTRAKELLMGPSLVHGENTGF